jgi:hypothetical protein
MLDENGQHRKHGEAEDDGPEVVRHHKKVRQFLLTRLEKCRQAGTGRTHKTLQKPFVPR